MNRLTKNMDTQYDFIGTYDTNIEEFTNNKKLRISVMNKLGQLEDIEEELGIDLITLFKAIMNGFWLKRISNYDFVEPYSYIIDLESSRLVQLYEENTRIFYFEDYGKTWALTKEELENL